jgi:hypothetical protein
VKVGHGERPASVERAMRRDGLEITIHRITMDAWAKGRYLAHAQARCCVNHFFLSLSLLLAHIMHEQPNVRSSH